MSSGKFQVEDFHRDVPEEVLLLDIKRVCSEVGKSSISFRQYNSLGQYSASTVALRFGTWNNALLRAGIEVSARRDYSDSELFENLLSVWIALARQPRTRELSQDMSVISIGPYLRRFGSWNVCLSEFVKWANEREETDDAIRQVPNLPRRTPRTPSSRLRFRVLKRDNFACVACGMSPANVVGAVLHVDHVLPWSKGGLTVENNLQTLCGTCNLGKSNVL